MKHVLPCAILLGAVAAPAGAQLTFSDQTDAAGLAALHTCAGPMQPMCEMMGGGAVGDFDRDGWPDLFVLGGGRAPDRLFHNLGDGTFVEVGEACGVARTHMGSGVSVADVDGDGWLDVFVTSFGDAGSPSPGQHLLYSNDGDGTFTEMALAAGVSTASEIYVDGFGAAFGDVDLDGDVDLFVTGWRTHPYPSRGNRLFRNEGDGTFTDVTGRDVIVLAKTHGFSPTFCDMDGDRYPELLLAADFGTSRYYVNDGTGSFVEATQQAGVGLDANGMGSVVADLDNDGRLDWYVTSVHDPLGVTPLVGDGNKLYWNEGGHRFAEGAERAGVHAGAWGWGTLAFDADHDGWIDLLETNGFPFPGFLGQPARVWLNDGDRTFTEVARAVGLVHFDDGRGMIDLDYDRDGDRDVVILSHGGRLRLYRNDLAGPDAHWLVVQLDTSARPDLAPDGLGARVEVRIGDRTFMRVLDGGCRYLTNSESTAHFGLGAATVVDELVVTWNDGSTTARGGVLADRYVTVSSTR